MFSGPGNLPVTDDQAFEVVVKSVAGVMPRRALDLSKKGEYKEVPLGNAGHSRLSQPGVVEVGNRAIVSLFLAEYTAKQDIKDQIDEVTIEEFLYRYTPRTRKNEIARDMLSIALDVSLADLNPVYNDLKEEGYIRRHPETFRKVAKRLVRCHSLGHYRKVVTQQLIAA